MARGIRRKLYTALGAVFVPVFLAALLVQNVSGFLRRPIPLSGISAEFLSALGADQRWPMFGAYFPDHVRIPIVRLGRETGPPVFLLPAAGPGLSAELRETFDLSRVSEAARTADWRFAFGTGRIEKYESRAASPGRAWIGIRTAYAAWRIRRWLERTGTSPASIRFVDLLSVAVKSAHDGQPLEVFRIDTLELIPEFFPDWPVRRARSMHEDVP